MSVTIADVRAAAEVIRGRLHRTPTWTCSSLGDDLGIELNLKAELFQKTGSFKPRGAINRLERTDPQVRARGVVTISSGNFAAALAFASRDLAVPCTVVMPESAPRAKVAATRAYGAEVILHGDVGAAFDRAVAISQERGLDLVHPFDDPRVIAGQGTVGLELIEDVPDADLVVVPLGGGGLLAGVAVAVKALRRQARVVGVEPVGAPAMSLSLAAGRAVRLDGVDTIADGLAPPMAGEHTFEVIERLVDEVVLVTDAEITAAMVATMSRAKLFVEPSGAAAVAALMSGRIDVRPGTRTVAVVSGGNLDPRAVNGLVPVARMGAR